MLRAFHRPCLVGHLAVCAMVFFLGSCAKPSIPADCDGSGETPLPQKLCDKAPESDPEDARGNAPLTIRAVVERVIRTNPDIGISALAERENALGVDIAQAARRPSLDLSAAAGPQVLAYQGDGDPNMLRREATLTLRQTLWDFGASSSELRRAEKAEEGARRARQAQTDQVVFDLLASLLQYREQTEISALLSRHLGELSKLQGIVKDREASGLGDQTDVENITLLVESVAADLEAARDQRDRAVAEVYYIAEIDPARIDMNALEKLASERRTHSARDFEANPKIAAIEAEIEALKFQLAAKKAERFPTIGLQGTARLNRNVNSALPEDRAGGLAATVTLRWNLYSSGSRHKQEDVLLLQIEDAELRLEKQIRMLGLEASKVEISERNASREIVALESKKAAASSLVEINKEKFRTGELSAFVLVDAQQQLLDAERAVIMQSYENYTSVLRNLLLDGRLVEVMLSLEN